MKNINYLKVYSKLIKDFPERSKKIFALRFGIKDGEPKTLQAIGDDFDITRERVRQIEAKGFADIKKKHSQLIADIFDEYKKYFEKNGSIKREDLVLQDLGGEKNSPYVRFFLNLGDDFFKVCEKEDFHPFWTIQKEAPQKVKKALKSLVSDLNRHGQPLEKNEFLLRFSKKQNFNSSHLLSFVEVAKSIKQNQENQVGLVDWPQINPKGVKDKSYLVFKKEKSPLHFRKVAKLIDEHGYNPGKKTYPQTVHNELIKDSRFVLVGRGLYALKEWGYVSGTVKDVISKTIKDSDKEDLTKEEIVDKVLSQRKVARNTVLMNLNNNPEFSKTSEGKYTLREA